MTNNYTRKFKTTENKKSVEKEIILYEYLIEYMQNANNLIQIKFVSEYGNIIPEWINFQYNSKEIKLYDSKQLVGKLDAWTHLMDQNIWENCLRLKDRMIENNFFGVNVLRYSDEINQTSAYFQILDLREYKNNELIYRKGGVKSDEVSIKISNYRHLLEWNIAEKTVKLTILDINSGQEYSRESYIIFELRYDKDTKFITPEYTPDVTTKNEWVNYVSEFIEDPEILNEVTSLITKVH